MKTYWLYHEKGLVGWIEENRAPNIGSTIGTSDQGGNKTPKWKVVGYLKKNLQPARRPTTKVAVLPIENGEK